MLSRVCRSAALEPPQRGPVRLSDNRTVNICENVSLKACPVDHSHNNLVFDTNNQGLVIQQDQRIPAAFGLNVCQRQIKSDKFIIVKFDIPTGHTLLRMPGELDRLALLPVENLGKGRPHRFPPDCGLMLVNSNSRTGQTRDYV